MSKNISIVEDLIALLPTSPFRIFLDNENQEKNSITLTENLNFQESDDLIRAEQNVLYESTIRVYIAVTEENADFNNIYNILHTFYFNLKDLESSRYKDKYVFEVFKNGIFGYLGRDKDGTYCFSMNLSIKYYV